MMPVTEMPMKEGDMEDFMKSREKSLANLIKRVL